MGVTTPSSSPISYTDFYFCFHQTQSPFLDLAQRIKCRIRTHCAAAELYSSHPFAPLLPRSCDHQGPQCCHPRFPQDPLATYICTVFLFSVTPEFPRTTLWLFDFLSRRTSVYSVYPSMFPQAIARPHQRTRCCHKMYAPLSLSLSLLYYHCASTRS